ncbi:MAG TPA: lysophospholipid acyltransferase family protein [Tepidisphaeraceae bacterium]|nr:lysophospholipid acyltransferase family protein [Tepidisphaeraceae bacterium]
MPTVDHLLSVRVLKAVNTFYCHRFHHLDLVSPPRLPPTGPAILVCNHTSGLDPFLIQSVCSRAITWMMAREFYEMPVVEAVFKHIGAIPVSRSGRDTTATRAAIRALHEGHVLGIFPEGRIERQRALMPFQTGVAMMAIKTKVPVYPACLDGTQRNKTMLQAFLESNDAQLAFGEPLELDRSSTDRDALAEATARIQFAVQSLLDKLRPR